MQIEIGGIMAEQDNKKKIILNDDTLNDVNGGTAETSGQRNFTSGCYNQDKKTGNEEYLQNPDNKNVRRR